MKAIGSPKRLAEKLGISESSIYEYINTMKAMKCSIKYSKSLQSYYYTEKGKFSLCFQAKELTETELKNTFGGFSKKNITFFQTPEFSEFNDFNLHSNSKIEFTRCAKSLS